MLREHPSWLNTPEGKMINRGCTEIVRGSEWESALFAADVTDLELRRFRRESEKLDRSARPWMYGDDDDSGPEGAA